MNHRLGDLYFNNKPRKPTALSLGHKLWHLFHMIMFDIPPLWLSGIMFTLYERDLVRSQVTTDHCLWSDAFGLLLDAR